MKFLFLFRKPYYPRISEIEKQPQVIPFSLLKDVGKLAVKFRDHPRLEDIIKLNIVSTFVLTSFVLLRDIYDVR